MSGDGTMIRLIHDQLADGYGQPANDLLIL